MCRGEAMDPVASNSPKEGTQTWYQPCLSLSLSLYVCKGKISCLPVKERAPLPQLFSDFQKWISEFRSASPLPGAYFLKLFS